MQTHSEGGCVSCLLGSQGLHGFDHGGAAAGKEGCDYGGDGEGAENRDDDGQISRRGAVEKSAEALADAEACDVAECEAEHDGGDDGSEHEAVDTLTGCSEGHADADLLGAGFDGVAEGAVDAEEREEQSGCAEGYEDAGFEVFGGERVGELRVEGVDAGDGYVGVVAPDGVADGFDELGGVLGAADEEVGAVGRIVPVGKIDHVDGRGAE